MPGAMPGGAGSPGDARENKWPGYGRGEEGWDGSGARAAATGDRRMGHGGGGGDVDGSKGEGDGGDDGGGVGDGGTGGTDGGRGKALMLRHDALIIPSITCLLESALPSPTFLTNQKP